MCANLILEIKYQVRPEDNFTCRTRKKDCLLHVHKNIGLCGSHIYDETGTTFACGGKTNVVTLAPEVGGDRVALRSAHPEFLVRDKPRMLASYSIMFN
jgi:hypothetical protein